MTDDGVLGRKFTIIGGITAVIISLIFIAFINYILILSTHFDSYFLQKAARSGRRASGRGRINGKCPKSAAPELLVNSVNFAANPCTDFYSYACGNWPKSPGIRYNSVTAKVRNDVDEKLHLFLASPKNKRDISAYIKAKVVYQSCLRYGNTFESQMQSIVKDLGGLYAKNCSHAALTASTFQYKSLTKCTKLPANWSLQSLLLKSRQFTDAGIILQYDKYSYCLKNSSLMLREGKTGLVARRTAAYGRIDDNNLYDVLRVEKIVSDARKAGTSTLKSALGSLDSLYRNVLNWESFFKGALSADGILYSRNNPVVILSSGFFETLNRSIPLFPKKALHNYVVLATVVDLYNRRPFAILDKSQCLEITKKSMDLVLGSIYVKTFFNDKAKAEGIKMTSSIFASFKEVIEGESWLSSSAKKIATDKLVSMKYSVGYPDYLKNDTFVDEYYAGLNVTGYFNINYLNLARFGDWKANQLWNLQPYEYNAGYSSGDNHFEIPGTLLMPPLFYTDMRIPSAFNYGLVASIIAHEIVHGFDVHGIMYDNKGVRTSLFKPEVMQEFDRRTECFVSQYSNMSYFGYNVNGKRTLSENIADNAGLQLAMMALGKDYPKYGTQKSMCGFSISMDKLFYLSFAQFRCSDSSALSVRNDILFGVHSPNAARVNGAVSNNPNFAKAFKCKTGTNMNPVKKCQVW